MNLVSAIKTKTNAKAEQAKSKDSKYVEAKTLAEMEFDVEEYKVAKDENQGTVEELKAKFKKIKRGLA
jgi:hypothetical protein